MPSAKIPFCPAVEDDAALLEALLAGTPAAGRRFIGRHGPFLRAIVLSASRGASIVVDDLTHDAYVHLWRDDFRVLRQWQREYPLRAYLRTVVTRLVWDRLTHLRPAWEQLENDPWTAAGVRAEPSDLQQTPEEELTANELTRVVRDALDGLSANDRQPLELRYVRELSYREVADVLGITPSHAGVRITRALARLRRAFSQLIDDTDRSPIYGPAAPSGM